MKLKINFLTKVILFFISMISVQSCASYKYTDTERETNNTITIKSNVKNFQIDYENMNERQFKRIESLKLYTTTGEIKYRIPKLNRKYTLLKIESPGYETKYLKVKYNFRREVVIRDAVCTLWPFLLIPVPFAIDVFRNDTYKINDDSKFFNIDFSPIKK